MHPAFTRRNSRHRGWLPRTLVAAGAVSALLLAGCGSSGTSSTEAGVKDSAPAQDRATGRGAPDAKSRAPGAPSAGLADTPKSGAPVVGVGPKLTRNASLDLRVKDVATGAARVRGIALGLQAQVLSEQIGGSDPGGPVPLEQGSESPNAQTGFGTLSLSVPADKLNTALDQISKQVGTVLRRSTSAQDVTTQYVDTESRLKTMRASVARVRALMTQARDIGQVVTLESELSRRQSDLESLESQLGALENSVERSTLTLTLSTPGNEPETSNGFLAGLSSGWDAFTASAGGLLTAIGAVLPFAVFFALLGAPIVWWLHRRQTNRRANLTPSGL